MNLIRAAVLSDDGVYRYRLDRSLVAPDWGWTARTLGVIMINPSTADAFVDDATIRKVCGFALRICFTHVVVGNLFAFRATDVRALLKAPDPVGPDNDLHLDQIIASTRVLVAWGPEAKQPRPLRGRWREVVRKARDLNRMLWCLGTCADGHPRHPLMVPYAQPLVEWRPPA